MANSKIGRQDKPNKRRGKSGSSNVSRNRNIRYTSFVHNTPIERMVMCLREQISYISEKRKKTVSAVWYERIFSKCRVFLFIDWRYSSLRATREASTFYIGSFLLYWLCDHSMTFFISLAMSMGCRYSALLALCVRACISDLCDQSFNPSSIFLGRYFRCGRKQLFAFCPIIHFITFLFAHTLTLFFLYTHLSLPKRTKLVIFAVFYLIRLKIISCSTKQTASA